MQLIDTVGIYVSQQVYKIQVKLEPNAGVIAKQTRAAGQFILATNVLNINQLRCIENKVELNI